jgi:ketosteroid isomerase-like protein
MTAQSGTIASLYAAFARGDVATVLGAFAADISWTEAEGFPYAGTYIGTYKATGKSFRAPFAHVWKFSGGRVKSFWQHTDTAVVQRALK